MTKEEIFNHKELADLSEEEKELFWVLIQMPSQIAKYFETYIQYDIDGRRTKPLIPKWLLDRFNYEMAVTRNMGKKG